MNESTTATVNKIAPEKERLAISLFLKGESGRRVASLVGIDKNTAWTIGKRTKAEHGTIYCQCGKVAGHREWCSPRIARSPGRIRWLCGAYKNIASVNIYVPSRPRYERPDIPNERETEVSLLTNNRRFVCLDAPVFEDSELRHSFIADPTVADPLQILMDKEEEWEKVHRQREVSRFEEFKNKQRLGVELGQGDASYAVKWI